jgi:hypothetical protein
MCCDLCHEEYNDTVRKNESLLPACSFDVTPTCSCNFYVIPMHSATADKCRLHANTWESQFLHLYWEIAWFIKPSKFCGSRKKSHVCHMSNACWHMGVTWAPSWVRHVIGMGSTYDTHEIVVQTLHTVTLLLPSSDNAAASQISRREYGSGFAR